MRRLGNQGLGLDAIAAALEDPNPRTRRGAARIFAYQFHGMDDRLDLAERLLELSRDPDLWTRLQALRTLRQWFYRTNDPALRPADRRHLPRADGRARRPPSCART